MDCGWGSSDDEASMQIDLEAKQDETTTDNSTSIEKPEGASQTNVTESYDPAEPTDDYDPTEPTDPIEPTDSAKADVVEKKRSGGVCDGDDGGHDLDYDPADPTLSEDELDITKNGGVGPEKVSEDIPNEKGDLDDQDKLECNDESAQKDVSGGDEEEDGRWDSQMASSLNIADISNDSSPQYDNTSSPEKEIEDSGGKVIGSEDVNGEHGDGGDDERVSGAPVKEMAHGSKEDGGMAPTGDGDENSQMSALSEANNVNDNAVGDEGLSDDVPEVTFDDSDFVLEKEPFGERERDRSTENEDGEKDLSERTSRERNENDGRKSKSSPSQSKWDDDEEEDVEAKEREWRRRRQEEVAHLNEEALVDLFREESEPDKEIVEGEMAEPQATKKTKKKVGSKKLKKKGKKLKGQGKKGQQSSSKSTDPDRGDQRFVEISRERPSVESREEGELDGEGGHGASRRRSSYDDRGSHQYNHRHEERGGYHHNDHNEPREPGEIVESEGKKKGVKKKDKKEKKKKKSRREVATIEEGNQGDEDSQKFPSFLAGFFVQDGMEELEEGQEGFANDFDEEDPRSLFAKASGDSNYRKRQEGSDREESARSFERPAEHEGGDSHFVEGSEHWRRRHDERWHESREARHDSRERRHGSREGRYERERDRRLEVSNDRDKEREAGRSRSERGRDRGRADREREREREKEAERERERHRRSGEERRRGRASRSRSRERRRRSASRERNRRSRSRDRSDRRRRQRSRSQDKSAERERDRERERERSRRRRRERSRERESERRVRRVSNSKSRSPRRRSERASSNKENREEQHRRRQRQRARSEEEESEERETGRRYRHQRRRERERDSSPTESSSNSSSSQSPAHRPQLHHLNFHNYSEDEGNSSDVILVEPERIVINLDEEEDPPSRVDITHGNAGDDGNAMLQDGRRVPPPPELAMGSRSSALIRINPAADEDTRVVEASNDLEETGDATPTRDEASDIPVGTGESSEAVKESDYDPAHPTEEDNEDTSAPEKEQASEQSSKSPVAATASSAASAPTPDETTTTTTAAKAAKATAPPLEKGPVPPDHPPPEEIRPSPPPIPAESESSVPPPHQQLQQVQQQQQQQQLGPPPPMAVGNLMNNPVMRLINPLLLQQQQKQLSLGAQPGGGLLPLPNTPPTRMPFMMNQNRGGESEGGPPQGFPGDQQRHIRPLLQIPDRRPPGFGPGGPDSSSSLLRHPFGPGGPMGQQQQQQPNANNMPPNMHPRMPISAMPPLAQLTSLLPALEKAKMAQQQQQDGRMGHGPGLMFGKHHPQSLLGKPPPLSMNSLHNMPFRPNRSDFSESTEVVDMDMSPGENDCELELPSPNSDSSKEGRSRKRSSRGSGSRNLAAAAAGKGVVQPIAYLKALSKALEKLDPKGQSGSNSQDKGKSGGSSKKHRKVDLNDDDVPASAVDLTNKEKYMRKLHLQERVIDEVKLAIKPFYSSKKINKDQYKLILRKAVPKVCHCKGGNINPQKIQQLVEAYVKKMIKKHGGGQGGSGKKKSKGASKDGAHNAKDGGVKQNGERTKKAVAGR